MQERSSKGLHLVVASDDGFVYIIDGRTGKYRKIDISERVYSMVLADDLLGNKKMDLLLTTMNGNAILLATNSPYHPMKSWKSQVQGLNGFTARSNHQGIFFAASQHDSIVVSM